MSGTPGRLVVISGPSGAGKSTIAHALARHPGVWISVSMTSRAPRAGEQDGVDYHFVSEAEFRRRAGAGELLEHAEVHGRLYGTLVRPIRERMARGETVLLVIDVQGARRLRDAREPLTSIFVLPPALDVLEKRLRDRGTETEASIARRLETARAELAEQHLYDHRIVNSDLAATIAAVEDILGLGPSVPSDAARLPSR